MNLETYVTFFDDKRTYIKFKNQDSCNLCNNNDFFACIQNENKLLLCFRCADFVYTFENITKIDNNNYQTTIMLPKYNDNVNHMFK